MSNLIKREQAAAAVSGEMHGLQVTIHQVVTQCLDSQAIEREKLEEAYAVLIEASSASIFAPHMPIWLNTQCDLYRALMVASLLLRLQYAREYDEKKCRRLEDSVERCFLMLHILVAVKETENDLARCIPPSTHNILNSLLQEPLIPLVKAERDNFWSMNDSSDHDMDSDGEDDTNTNQLVLPDKKQLALEEQQLLSMAQRPIPSAAAATTDEALPERPTDILVQNGNDVQLFRCGVLVQDKGKRTVVLSSQTTVQKIETPTTVSIQVTTQDDPVNTVQLTHITNQNVTCWMDAFDVALQHARIRDELREELSLLDEPHMAS